MEVFSKSLFKWNKCFARRTKPTSRVHSRPKPTRNRYNRLSTSNKRQVYSCDIQPIVNLIKYSTQWLAPIERLDKQHDIHIDHHVAYTH